MTIVVWGVPGLGEVGAGDDLTAVITDALRSDLARPLRDGDILVVTSKVVSKAEGRLLPADQRDAAVSAESVGTVARRGGLRIVRTRSGLVQAAAGVDASNLPADRIALLPADADASAEHLRRGLAQRLRADVGVLISDTAGRAWRIGQTDHVIGAAGVRLVQEYAGRDDPYGNRLQVTVRALGDEIAAAADLVKGKLRRCPVAVVRGLAPLVVPEGPPARALVRPIEEDLFRLGIRESVLWSLLAALDAPALFESLVGEDSAEVLTRLREPLSASGVPEEFARRLLAATD